MQTFFSRLSSCVLMSVSLLIVGGCGVHAPETQPVTKVEEPAPSVAQPQVPAAEPPSLETFDASLNRA
ncbi:MAG: hypothetical protein ACRERD_27050 [Candidatus Binatia bacterium]